MPRRQALRQDVVGRDAVELQLISRRIPPRADRGREDVRVAAVHAPLAGKVLGVEGLQRPLLLPGVVRVVGVEHCVVVRERTIEQGAGPGIAGDVVVVATLIIPIAAPQECRRDRTGVRQFVLPGARELVHIGPSVDDAAVLGVAERHPERESPGQRLIERRVAPRRGAEDVRREHIRRV